MNKIGILLIWIAISGQTSAQRFTGFQAAKRAAEFEAQKFLMTEVYNLAADQNTELRLQQCAEFVDDDQSFIFVLTAYRWNGDYGIVISSLVAKSDWDKSDIWKFKNINLTEKEYNLLNQTIAELNGIGHNSESHQLRRFDTEIVAEYNKDRLGEEVVLWVGDNRHAFPIESWNSFYKSFAQFKQSSQSK